MTWVFLKINRGHGHFLATETCDMVFFFNLTADIEDPHPLLLYALFMILSFH